MSETPAPSEPSPPQDGIASPSEDTSDTDALSAVLRSTVEQTVDGDALPPSLIKALKEVGATHGDEMLKLEPVATALVHATLVDTFRVPESQLEPWRELAREVANSLLDDQNARQRLERLWHRLSEQTA